MVLKYLNSLRIPKTIKTYHVVFIMLAVLLLNNLGYGFKEYFENNDVSDSNNSPDGLPVGISRTDIPQGEEDMYILKSEIVPPVCPKCPDISVCPDKEAKCQPCPPCGRCPEPSFECKRVPTYRPNDNSMPRPILTDFSQFGI